MEMIKIQVDGKSEHDTSHDDNAVEWNSRFTWLTQSRIQAKPELAPTSLSERARPACCEEALGAHALYIQGRVNKRGSVR